MPDQIQFVRFAVLPFLHVEGPGHIPGLLSTVIETKFDESPFYRIVKQENMNSILKAEGSELRVDRCSSIECADKIVSLLSVDYALMGTVRTQSNHIELTLRLVKTAGGFVKLYEKHIYDARDIDLSAELIQREITAELFPEYIDYIGTLYEERDITPDVSLEGTENQDQSASPQIDPRPKTNNIPLELSPLHDNPVTRYTAGVVGGLAGVNIGALFQVLEGVHYYSYLEDYDSYSNSTDPAELDELWEDAQSSYTDSMAAKTLSGIFWAGGLGAAGISVWGSGTPMLNMSGKGRLLFTGGYILQTTAGATDLISMYYLSKSHVAYMQYSNAGSGFDSYWDEYQKNLLLFRLYAATSAAIRVSGTLMTAGAVFWPDKNTRPLLSGFWDKLFFSTSLALWAGGNISFSNAMDAQRRMDSSRYEYLRLDPASLLLDDYRREWKQNEEDYKNQLIVTGSLWGGSVLFFVSALVFDFPDPGRKNTKDATDEIDKHDPAQLQLSVWPRHDGVGFIGQLSL